MVGKIWFRIVAALLLIAGIVALGVFAYNLGVARGTTLGVNWAEMPAKAAGMAPYGYHHPLGLGLLACGLPLLLAFLFFGALRHLLFFRRFAFGGPRHWVRHSHWSAGDRPEHIPPFVEEWHRKMHENQPPAAEAPDQKST